jgi:hypothetical protein
VWGRLYGQTATATGWRFADIRWLTLHDVADLTSAWASPEVEAPKKDPRVAVGELAKAFGIEVRHGAQVER